MSRHLRLSRRSGAQRLLLALSCLLLATAARAQVRIEGRVLTETGKPVARAIVRATAPGSDSILAYASSGADGRYALTLSAAPQRIVVRATHLSYAPAKVEAEGRSQQFAPLVMLPSSAQLREVTVRAPVVRQRGDTLSYEVGRLRQSDDRTIEDVLRRIPGITLEGSGRIKYNGEDINRFYIEGLDMLGGNYTLATRNVRADDVARVEVMERHQPVRALEGMEASEQAALNLRLKRRALLRPSGYVRGGAGGGAGTSWMGEAFLMLIAATHQHMASAKGSNFGQNYGDEAAGLTGFGLDEATPEAASAFARDVFATGALPAVRHQEGTSAMASGRSLVKLAQATTLTLGGSYDYGAQRYGSDRLTDYLGADGQRIVVDEQGQTSLSSQLARLSLRLEHNAPTLYVMNELKLRGSFARNRYAAAGTVAARQRNATDTYSLTDELRLVTRRERRAWRVEAGMSYGRTPGASLLAVDPQADTLLAAQHAAGHALRARGGTSMEWALGRHLTLGVALQVQAQHDRLESQADADAPARNDARGYQVLTTLGPYMQLRRGIAVWKVRLGVTQYDLSLRNAATGQGTSLHRPYFSPTASVSLKFSPVLRGQASVGYGVRHGGLTAFATAPIWATYRQRTTMGSGQLPRTDRFNSSAGLTLANSFKGYDLSLRGSFALTHNETMRSSNVSALGTQTASVARASTARRWSATATYKHNFYESATLLTLSALLGGSRSELLRQDVAYATRSLTSTLSAALRQPLCQQRLVPELAVTWMRSAQQTVGLGARQRLDNLSALARLSVFPVKAWQLFFTANYSLNELEPGQLRGDFFLDGGMRYAHGRWEAELQARNLTNRRLYVIRSYTDLDVTTDTYRLRPAEALATLRYNF